MNSNEVVDLLAKLVACPSVNPKHQVPAGPPYGEGRLVELLARMLKSWGAETRIQQVSEGRPNLIAHFQGRDRSRSLLLEAHSDTVQVDDMKIAPFEPKVQNGKLFGRGACDTKGPMASLLMAIKRVLDEDVKPPTDLYFVSTCDEELGAGGAHALMETGFQADAAVVGEPTELAIIRAHKGAIRWKIQTHGVAAHSSEPTRGLNAIYQMRKVIEAIEERLAPEVLQREHPLLGHPTVSVGTIRGGTQVNVIPSKCKIEVDRRLTPDETKQSATEEMMGILQTLRNADTKFDYSIEQTEWYPAFQESQEAFISKIVEASCQKILGKAVFSVAPWSANAGVFKMHGIPCVLFGPGAARQAHSQEEYIELDQVEKACDVYATIIRLFK